jgi:hypothetical protein
MSKAPPPVETASEKRIVEQKSWLTLATAMIAVSAPISAQIYTSPSTDKELTLGDKQLQLADKQKTRELDRRGGEREAAGIFSSGETVQSARSCRRLGTFR